MNTPLEAETKLICPGRGMAHPSYRPSGKAEELSERFPHRCSRCFAPAWISPVGARIDCSAKCGV